MSNRFDRRRQNKGRGMVPSTHTLPDGAPADDALDGRVVDPDRSARPVANGNPVEANGPVGRTTAPRLKRERPPKEVLRVPTRYHLRR